MMIICYLQSLSLHQCARPPMYQTKLRKKYKIIHKRVIDKYSSDRPGGDERCRITLMLIESSLVGNNLTASSTFLPRNVTPLIASIRSPIRNAPVLQTVVHASIRSPTRNAPVLQTVVHASIRSPIRNAPVLQTVVHVAVCVQ